MNNLTVHRSWPVGTWNILRFNWPQYAGAAFCLAGALVLVVAAPVSGGWNVLLLAAVGLCAWWTGASLAASFWIYDFSRLTDWQWLREMVPCTPDSPRELIQLHCGFDDASPRLRQLFPTDRLRVVDLFDARRMTEPSIHRARRSSAHVPTAITGKPESLPLRDHECDGVLLLMAAHEIRDAGDRRQFFSELHRIVRPGGRVILVEHLRDAWNFIAFGPGAWHFFSRREWTRLAAGAGLTIQAEGRVTPFVRYFVWEK